MNTPWVPEDHVALTPAWQSMASAVPAGELSDHDLANVAQAVYFAVQSGDAAGAVARLRDLTVAASNLAFEALAKSHDECDQLRAKLNEANEAISDEAENSARLRKLLGELFTIHCLTLRAETGHPCPENISTLQEFRAAIATQSG